MLITFKSPAAPEVTMLDDLAKYLLGIIGKSLGERGVITHHEAGAAIEKLEAAVLADKAAVETHQASHYHDDELHHELPLGLAQRAFPFLEMLRATRDSKDADIVWGV